MNNRIAYLSLFIFLIISVSLIWVIFSGEASGEQDELLEEYRPHLNKTQPLVLRKDDFRQLSPWQAYVTPLNPVVIECASSLETYEDAYRMAVRWVWVSDNVLHNCDELWMKPMEFISLTPDLPTNPAQGFCSSDCEEHAYTLVSILRAMGVGTEDVRVCVGLVETSDGSTGGHAWAELYVDGKWVQLEATSGPYWDEDAHMLRERKGAPYAYYSNHPYPVVEVWGYFNDMYYYNVELGDGVAPPFWKALSSANHPN